MPTFSCSTIRVTRTSTSCSTSKTAGSSSAILALILPRILPQTMAMFWFRKITQQKREPDLSNRRQNKDREPGEVAQKSLLGSSLLRRLEISQPRGWLGSFRAQNPAPAAQFLCISSANSLSEKTQSGFDASLGWGRLNNCAELTWFGGCSYKEPIFRHR
jgi:hypothetical protein